MRLRHIEIFYHVYREGSISAAARCLNVSQPSVSKTLKHAEDQLGFALFERIGGRLQPTARAHELFAETGDIYDRINAFNRTAQNLRNRSGGNLRLGVLASLGFAIVPRFIARMQTDNPDLRFDVSTLHTEDMQNALMERRFDLCLGFGDQPNARITQHHIGDVELLLLSLPGNLANSDEAFDLRQLAGEDFVGLEDSGPVAAQVRSHFQAIDTEPNIVVTAQTHYVAASLVRLGVGKAIVDRFTSQSIAGHGLAATRCKGLSSLPFAVMHLQDPSPSPLLTQSIATLKRLFEETRPDR